MWRELSDSINQRLVLINTLEAEWSSKFIIKNYPELKDKKFYPVCHHPVWGGWFALRGRWELTLIVEVFISNLVFRGCNISRSSGKLGKKRTKITLNIRTSCRNVDFVQWKLEGKVRLMFEHHIVSIVSRIGDGEILEEIQKQVTTNILNSKLNILKQFLLKDTRLLKN